jgi:hypothetical protein
MANTPSLKAFHTIRPECRGLSRLRLLISHLQILIVCDLCVEVPAWSERAQAVGERIEKSLNSAERANARAAAPQRYVSQHSR